MFSLWLIGMNEECGCDTGKAIYYTVITFWAILHGKTRRECNEKINLFFPKSRLFLYMGTACLDPLNYKPIFTQSAK